MPLQNNGKLTAAIVGAGLMGRYHADAIRRAGAQITSIVDPDQRRAEALAKRYFPAKMFPSLDDALRESRPTVVHLCTPSTLHYRQAEQALKAGAHVFAEKPLTPILDDTENLLRLAESSGLRVCPVHQFIFQNGVQRVRASLPSAGDVVQVSFVIHSAGGTGLPPEQLDTLVADILPHPLSILQFFFPGSLTSPWLVNRPTYGELRVVGTRGSSGSSSFGITIEISMNARPTQNAMTISCRNTTFHVDLFHGFAFRLPGTVSRMHKIVQPFEFSVRQFANASSNLAVRILTNEGAYPGLRRLVNLFYEALRTGENPPISSQDTLAVARARQAILAS